MKVAPLHKHADHDRAKEDGSITASQSSSTLLDSRNCRPSTPELKTVLAAFQRPSSVKAAWQLTNSLVSYVFVWVLMFWSLKISYLLSLALSIAAGALVVRVFIIMHDCGHGSFTKSRLLNDIIGSIAGIVVFTPYYHWRWEHAVHHGTAADLDRRGTGDIWTMTVQEYLQSPLRVRLAYRALRQPIVLFALAPIFVFGFRNRFASRTAGRRERWSVWWTNAGVALIILGLSSLFGWKTYLASQLVITMVGGGIGIWMFYIQHQFEGVYWERHENWDYVAAALKGSSFYQLPKFFQWLSGNIGFHHIHHLNPRIPNYNLERCHRSHSVFHNVQTVTLAGSLASARLNLWDERCRRLVGFGQLKSIHRRSKF